jgi:hypothetical protein
MSVFRERIKDLKARQLLYRTRLVANQSELRKVIGFKMRLNEEEEMIKYNLTCNITECHMNIKDLQSQIDYWQSFLKNG